MEGFRSIHQQTARRVFACRTLIGMGGVLVGLLIVHPGRYGALNCWAVKAASLLLVALGLGLRAWAVAFAGHHTRTNKIEAPQLVTDGPYAHVRNPIYLGTIILGLGMVGFLGDPLLLPIYALTLAASFVGIIPAEERFLQCQFGEEYSRYRAAVRRLIPRWRPWSGARRKIPDWSAARGELVIAALLVVIILLSHAAFFLKSRI